MKKKLYNWMVKMTEKNKSFTMRGKTINQTKIKP